MGAICSPENDPDALVGLLRLYLDDPDLARATRQRGEVFRRGAYAAPVVAERVERLFEEAIAQHTLTSKPDRDRRALPAERSRIIESRFSSAVAMGRTVAGGAPATGPGSGAAVGFDAASRCETWRQIELSELVLVTGGAGYVGVPVCEGLLASGRRVRALDVLLHGQTAIADRLERAGVEVIRGDIRDPDARRAGVASMPTPSFTWLRSSAIRLAPAIQRSRTLSTSRRGRALVADARASRRTAFRVRVDVLELRTDGRPDACRSPRRASWRRCRCTQSRRSRSRSSLLGGDAGDDQPTCLRFATVYGAAPRMRFDLTVNEFTRDLWADRDLEVFGEQFWRPYVHVRDAALGVCAVLDAPPDQVAGEVFNVGRSDENYRKLDLVEEIRQQLPTGTVKYVQRDEDPRDYKVSFDKISQRLGFETAMTVPKGIAEVIARPRRTGLPRARSMPGTGTPLTTCSPVAGASVRGTESREPLPLFDLRLEQEDLDAVADTLRSGWLTMGPSTAGVRAAFAARLGARHAVAVSSCTAALHLAYLAAGVGPGDEVIVPSYTFAATASAVLYCGATPVFADIIGSHDLSIDPAEVERLITPRTKAVAAVHFAGYAAPVDRLAGALPRADVALIEDAAHSPSATLNGASSARSASQAPSACSRTRCSRSVRAACSSPTTTTSRALARAAADPRDDRHELGEAPGNAPASMTSPALGFNYRIDEPRSALALSRLARLEEEIARRRELTRRYRAELADDTRA